MTASTKTQWTCDRCGTIRHLNEREQPQSWAALDLTSPPKAATSEANRWGHLCSSCIGALKTWWETPTPTEVQS